MTLCRVDVKICIKQGVIFMSDAIVEFRDVADLLAPMFKERLVRVVWDESKATVTVVKKDKNRVLKAYGSLSAYADPSKIEAEKEAWPEAALVKHGNT